MCVSASASEVDVVVVVATIAALVATATGEAPYADLIMKAPARPNV